MSHLRYLLYLIKHKWFVFLAGRKLGVSTWQLLIHDWSKFTPAEWGPYVRRFYGGGGNDEEFRAAWLHHIWKNPHHWEHWCSWAQTQIERAEGTSLKDLETFLGYEPTGGVWASPIPKTYIREMLADWAGAGRAITGKWDVRTWFDENEDKMILHPDTRQILEDFFILGYKL